MTVYKFHPDATAKEIAEAICEMHDTCIEEPLHYDVFADYGRLYIDIRKGDCKIPYDIMERVL